MVPENAEPRSPECVDLERKVYTKRKKTKLNHKANNDLIVEFQALGHFIHSGMFIRSFIHSKCYRTLTMY